MEHDAQCALQDRELTLLKEQFRVANDGLKDALQKLDQLVNQYHEQQVIQVTMNGDVIHIREKVDAIEESLKKDYAYRSEFVEVKSEWRKFLGIILVAVFTTILSIIGWVVKGSFK
jgi:hypothetical protein